MLNLVEDRYKKFNRDYHIMNTDFLDMAQQSAAMPFVTSHSGDGVFMYGGYKDADRRQIVFMPDYTGVEKTEDIYTYFAKNPEDCPLAVLKVEIRQKGAVLRHSDYLGSLLSLGIKREKTGDILIDDKGAQIIVNREIADYLADNYARAGRVPVDTSVVPISELAERESYTERLRFTVSSVRLDNVISAVFGISRKSASEAISRGMVFVNSVETKKADRTVREGEKVVLRGKGKAVFAGSSGISRKGKIYVEFDRYI